MFNKELKKQITALALKVTALEAESDLLIKKIGFAEKENASLKLDVLKLKNTPEYKVGDKLNKDQIVISVDFIEKEFDYRFPSPSRALLSYWQYKILNTKTKEITIKITNI